MFTVHSSEKVQNKADEIHNIVLQKTTKKIIMEEIAFIKQNLLDIGCPLIQESEDLEQIRTLLTTPSDHKQQLIQWILQEVSDEVVDGIELNAKAKAFGFNFNTLNGWTMSLKVIKKLRLNCDHAILLFSASKPTQVSVSMESSHDGNEGREG